MSDNDDHDDESSACTSSSSSWATSDDERRFAPIVRRKKTRAEVQQQQLPDTVLIQADAESPKPESSRLKTSPKVGSPKKDPTKRKKAKKASSKGGEEHATANPLSPAKKKKATGEKGSSKSPAKKTPPRKEKAAPTTPLPKEIPSEVRSPVQSPTKKKKKPKESKVTTDTKPKATSSAAAASMTSPKTKKKKPPSAPEPISNLQEPKKKKEKRAKKVLNSIPNRPHTAPTVRKKKIMISSDDDSSIENGLPIQTPPFLSPAATKSKFSFSSDDSSCSSDDSSDSEYLRKKRAAEIREAKQKELNQRKVQHSVDSESSDSSSDDEPNTRAQTNADDAFTRSVPSRELSGESTDSEPPISLGLRPGRQARSMSLGSTDTEPPISLSMRPGNLSRTLSADTTDSEPPINLSLRPGQIQRSLSTGTTDSEPPISLSMRPGQLQRSMSTDTIDSEPPFSLSLRPGQGVTRTFSAESTDSEPPFSLGLRPGAPARVPMRTQSHNSTSSSSSEPPFPMGLRAGASLQEQNDFDKAGRVDRVNLRPPTRTYSIESTDSEPPISLGLRPGAPNLIRSAQDLAQEHFNCERGDHGSHTAAFEQRRQSKPFVSCPSYVPTREEQADIENLYRSAIAKAKSTHLQQSGDSNGQCQQIDIESMYRSAIAKVASKHVEKGGDSNDQPEISTELRQSKSFVPCPSYVPATNDQVDVESMYLSAIAKAEPKQATGANDRKEMLLAQNATFSGSFESDSNRISSSSFGYSADQRNAPANLVPVDQAKVHGPKEQAQNDSLSEVCLRHVDVVEKKPQRKKNRRRESYLFRDLQRFAKKTANEIQSDDEGLSDDGSDDFCGEQSLNLLEAMEDSSQSDHDGADFHQSAPIAAIQSGISGKSGAIEPITPKFEDARKTFLRMSAANQIIDEGGPQKRRHSTLVPGQGAATNEKPCRRHSALATNLPSIGALAHDSSSNALACNSHQIDTMPSQIRGDQKPGVGKAARRHSAVTTTAQLGQPSPGRRNSAIVPHTKPFVGLASNGKVEQRKVPDRAPSASLSNVVSLQDRIKLLALTDGGNEGKKLTEDPNSVYASPQKNRFSKFGGSSPKQKAQNTVSSSMDALLSPRKEFSSKKSLHGLHPTKNAHMKGDSHDDKLGFHKSIGAIPGSPSRQPIWADKGALLKKKPPKGHDPNHDSLDDLQATVDALHKEIGKVEEETEQHSPQGDESGSEDDVFDESANAGNGLSKFFSAKKPSTKKEDDDQESMVSYDVQDSLTSFSQQRKLAMQRARASRPSGGKLGDRLKFLESS